MTKRAHGVPRLPQGPQKESGYKDLSYSNREGIDEKLKFMVQPYKMKVLKKCQKIVFWVHKDLSYSHREGIDKTLDCLSHIK